jgi:hypothetical protein
MKRIQIMAFILAVLAAAVSYAVVGTNNAVSVTSTAQTVAFTTARSAVMVTNDTASANELYFRLYWCGETVTAATTAGIRLEKGETLTFTYDNRTETGIGYCNISLVCASAETATARVVYK